MNVTVTVDTKPASPPLRLSGRAGEIVQWLASISDAVCQTEKGQIQIDYSGPDLVKKFLQIEERRGRK